MITDPSQFIAAQQAAVNSGQVMMYVCPLAMLLIFAVMVALAVYTVRKGKMPKTLEVLRDVRQPIRNHRHYHYSAKASLRPISEEEVEQYDVTSLS
jgi:hypothetical protein